MIESSGVDAIRLQFCTTAPGEQKRFSFNLMRESVIPFLTILYNCNNYYSQLQSKKCKLQVEDKWILSKLNYLIQGTTEDLEKFSIDSAFKRIHDFVVNDFSRGYIKITRERDDNKEIVGEILEKISLLLAPFAPYITEYVYGNFSKNSVHLSDWPEIQRKKIDKLLEKQFEFVLKIIELGLKERDKVQIGLRWPLKKCIIKNRIKLAGMSKFEEIIKSQLNVKDIDFGTHIEDIDISVELDTKITPELESEGYAREISRQIQDFRKSLGLQKKDEVKLAIITDENFRKILESRRDFIAERTNSKKLRIILENVTTPREEKSSKRGQFKERFKNIIDFKVKDKRGKLAIIA